MFAFNFSILLVVKGVLENRLLCALNFPVLCLCKQRAWVRAKMKKNKIENCWGRLLLQREKCVIQRFIYLSLHLCVSLLLQESHSNHKYSQWYMFSCKFAAVHLSFLDLYLPLHKKTLTPGQGCHILSSHRWITLVCHQLRGQKKLWNVLKLSKFGILFRLFQLKKCLYMLSIQNSKATEAIYLKLELEQSMKVTTVRLKVQNLLPQQR